MAFGKPILNEAMLDVCQIERGWLVGLVFDNKDLGVDTMKEVVALLNRLLENQERERQKS